MSVLLDDAACDLDLDALAVAGDQIMLVNGIFRLAFDLAGSRLVQLVVLFGWDELADWSAEQLGLRVAERSHEGRVDSRQVAVEVDRRNQIGGVLEQVSVAGFAQSECTLRLSSLADIDREHDTSQLPLELVIV